MGALVYAGQKPIKWAEAERLKDIIEVELPRRHMITGKVELSRTFNARNIEQQACIAVAWTSNIADHLLLKEEDREDGGAKVHIFHHASFLKHHQESGSMFLPNDLLDETTRTLALLFPQIDPKTRKWFQSHQTRFGLDPAAAECGFLSRRERQIDNFHYWRDRLAILKQAFDEAEPRSISGVWRDDRKKMQYYTFWIAVVILVLTVVFGLVQSITGIVQAWATVKSLNRG